MTDTPAPVATDASAPPMPPRLGLAFGGGLPFGLVALGVLRAFEENGIRVHRLAGTSMGSIVAAMYAAGFGIDESIARFQHAFTRKRMAVALLRDLSFSGSGILRGSEVVHMLESFIGKRTFEDLQLPLRIPACELTDGSEVVFESGPLVPAIRASISLPGIFEPFHYQGHTLVDGALIRPIPVHLLHNDEVDLKIPVRAVRRRSRTQLHDDVHAAHRSHRVRSLLHRGDDVFSVLWRAMSLIMQDEFSEMIFDDFDVYIKPELDLDLSRDPAKIPAIVAAGYDETMRVLPQIRDALAAAATRRTTRARLAGAAQDPLAPGLESEIQD